MSTYDTLDDERRKKLPKFAQDYMCGLENRIRELENLQHQTGKTAISFGWTMKTDEEGYIPEHSNVRFNLGVDGEIECYRRKIGQRFVLDVHGNRHSIRILPVASNVVHIVGDV